MEWRRSHANGLSRPELEGVGTQASRSVALIHHQACLLIHTLLGAEPFTSGGEIAPC